MNADTRTPVRLVKYIESQIADKEAERARLEGEVTALYAVLGPAKLLAKQAEAKA